MTLNIQQNSDGFVVQFSGEFDPIWYNYATTITD